MAVEIKMPQLGLTMTEGTVGTWHKKVGDPVKKGEVLVEITTDKLNSEIQSESDGVLLSILVEEGKDAPVMAVLGHIGAQGETVAGASAPASAPTATAPATASPAPQTSAPLAVSAGARIKISPLAKKTAQKIGADISNISGTGPGGRILQRDILSAPKGSAASVAAPAPAQNANLSTSVRREKLTGMRKTVGQRMLAAHNEIPSVTMNIKVAVDALLKLRAQINEKREKENKLSVNDFVLKAAAKALSQHKELLVSLDKGEIVYNESVNLGMAVALEEGLIVPVIKEADRISIETLSAKAKELAKKAREGKLSMDEYSGSTFTVSNLGMFGLDSFTSIINQPNSAILGVAAALDEIDIDDEGKVFKKKVMKIALTIDHRLMDGADGAKFVVVLKELLEHPMDILL
ncbi:MAG: 2-oxo acid dehydrogenase subunit E2 [Elusimicrobiota bacterium]|jgi:pyruvate dehydrogenase E2 component (dihydrolipoamide acetyltransferase)|nr:2-oxo acid dehydrogenase subunit E2 [Elusimicrobiota bacterium]